MSYFQTDDIPTSPPTKPRYNLMLIDAKGKTLLKNVKHYKIRDYYKENYGKLIGSNGKRIWREELTKLGYTVKNYTK